MTLVFLCTLEPFQTREREKRKKKKNNFPRLQPQIAALPPNPWLEDEKKTKVNKNKKIKHNDEF